MVFVKLWYMTGGPETLKVDFMLKDILMIAVRRGASDIHLKAGTPAVIRKHGVLQPLVKDGPVVSTEEIEKIAFSVMNKSQKEMFLEKYQVDIGFGISGLGRFRFNIFKQRGSMRIVVRTISMSIPSLPSLNLPKVVEHLTTSKRGLILVTGVTGAGKSTTIASMVNHMNSNFCRHILTIEDPIEFLIKDQKSLVTQRELGSDAVSFPEALKASLRQDPDVIFIGEMRDMETVDTALLAAATGHLVVSTLHTLHSTETINRILGFFPAEKHQQVRFQLASVLRAVISQRLTNKPEGQGFAPAVEILINNARIREMIEVPERTAEIPKALEEGGATYGMQTFDQSLTQLVSKKIISYEEAMRHATSPEDFAIKHSGVIHSNAGNDPHEEGVTSNYNQRIQSKWHNLTSVELENIDENTSETDKDLRIKKRKFGSKR